MSMPQGLAGATLVACLAACPLYATTVPGDSQSPINIVTRDAVHQDLPDLIFNYSDSARLSVVDTRPSFLDDENATVRADVCPVCGQVHGPGGVLVPSNLMIGDITYDLLQFHLHAPGEHEIDGEAGAMELHLVHRAASGALAVVGQLITIGERNEALAPYFDALSNVAGGAVEILDFDLTALIPDDLSSYRYSGSLTAPSPGNEDAEFFAEPVAWNILAQEIEVSLAQYNAFAALFSEEGEFIGNARGVQPLNGRTVLTDVAPIPLPASGVLFLFALGGLAAMRRRAT